MGKVGSIEMSFGSDLDMVVLFEDRGATNGEKIHYEYGILLKDGSAWELISEYVHQKRIFI